MSRNQIVVGQWRKTRGGRNGWYVQVKGFYAFPDRVACEWYKEWDRKPALRYTVSIEQCLAWPVHHRPPLFCLSAAEIVAMAHVLKKHDEAMMIEAFRIVLSGDQGKGVGEHDDE